MLKEQYDDPEELAEDLIGTCSIADPGELLGDDEEKIEAFDNLAFECHGCGWWCSVDELNNETDDNLCDECSPSEDEDEDA